jgi:hypothetical protein
MYAWKWLVVLGDTIEVTYIQLVAYLVEIWTAFNAILLLVHAWTWREIFLK